MIDNVWHPFVLQLNEGQTGGPVGVDINVLPVWRKGISGKGVVVSILDDGKQPLHVYHPNNNYQHYWGEEREELFFSPVMFTDTVQMSK